MTSVRFSCCESRLGQACLTIPQPKIYSRCSLCRIGNHENFSDKLVLGLRVDSVGQKVMEKWFQGLQAFWLSWAFWYVRKVLWLAGIDCCGSQMVQDFVQDTCFFNKAYTAAKQSYINYLAFYLEQPLNPFCSLTDLHICLLGVVHSSVLTKIWFETPHNQWRFWSQMNFLLLFLFYS